MASDDEGEEGILRSVRIRQRETLPREGKPLAHRAGLPGNVDVITGSALIPLQESVTALPEGHPADLPVTDGNGLLRTVIFGTFPL
jgi:hypothetical protein